MGRFSEKQLTILTIVVAFVISGLFAALIYRDVSAVDDEEQAITGLQAQIAVATAEKAKIPARETDVIVYREIVKRDSSILPDESEINEFINVIGDFEKFSGVVVTQVQGLSSGRGAKQQKEAIVKIPLQLKLRGSLDQFLKFINLFENYERFVSVTGFSISTGRGGTEADGVALHEVSLQLQTYQYDPKGSGETQTVEIPNYERRKQEAAIQTQIRSSKPAHIEKHPLKPRISRRDPLVDPRETDAPEAEAPGDIEELWKQQKAILDQLVLDVKLLMDDVRVEAKLKEDGILIRLGPVGRAIDQRMAQLDFQINNVLAAKEISISELRDQFLELVVQPYEEIKDQRAQSVNAGEVFVERKQVFDTLQKMKDKFTDGLYRDVIKIHEGFQRVTDGRKFDPEAEPLRQDMVVLTQQAQVITKFENEPLRIDGVIIDARRTSFAIINDLVLAEGDAVDTDRKILVRQITSDTIVFEYEGVRIPKVIRGK